MTKVIKLKDFMHPIIVNDEFCSYCRRKFKHGDIIVTLNSEDYYHLECSKEVEV